MHVGFSVLVVPSTAMHPRQMSKVKLETSILPTANWLLTMNRSLLLQLYSEGVKDFMVKVVERSGLSHTGEVVRVYYYCSAQLQKHYTHSVKVLNKSSESVFTSSLAWQPTLDGAHPPHCTNPAAGGLQLQFLRIEEHSPCA